MTNSKFKNGLFLALFSSLAVSCAHKTQVSDQEESISVPVALDFGRTSFVKGCVHMAHRLGKTKAFFWCVEEAKDHVKEIKTIMDSP